VIIRIFFKKPEEAMKIQKALQIFVAVMLLSSLVLLPANSLASASVLPQAEIPADAEFVPGELIVGLKEDGIKSAGADVSSIAASVNAEIASFAIDRSFYVVRFKSDADLEASMQAFAAMPGVAYVERNGIYRISQIEPPADSRESADIGAFYAPNDPMSGEQWHLDKIMYRIAPAPVATNVPCIVVIDTGVDYTHPDLAGKVYLGPDFITGDNLPMDENGHGTQAAGAAAAKTNNSVGISGVSPLSNILVVRVLNENTVGTYDQIANGILWANSVGAEKCGGQQPKIYTLSMGGPVNSPPVAAAIDAAKKLGRLVVASAGADNATVLYYPGADPNAFGVGDTEYNDKRAYYSNTNAALDIAAPGYGIKTATLPAPDLYKVVKGVTLSSPVVAGAAARIWSRYPTYTREQVMARLVNTGNPTQGFTTALKRINLYTALGYTKYSLQGQIFNSFAVAPMSGAQVTIIKSGTTTPVCTVTTSASGFYTCLLPSTGKYAVFAKKAGFVTPSQYFTVTTTTKSIFNANLVMTPLVGTGTSGDWSIVALWKGPQPYTTLGKEFDLWLVKFDKKLCYSPFGQSNTSPYIIAGKDSFGSQTENIQIKKAYGSALQVWVALWDGKSGSNYNWPRTSRLTGSGLVVTIYKNNKVVTRLTAPATPTTSNSDMWYVGYISPSAGKWVVANKIYTDKQAPTCITKVTDFPMDP
jgi:thermitase